jgi:hypothetical protein
MAQRILQRSMDAVHAGGGSGGIGWMIPAAGKMSQGTEVTWRFCAMLIMLSRLH